MRKLMLVAVLAVVGAGLLPTSASAFDPHFKVWSRETSFHKVGQASWDFKDRLFDPNNRSDKVGNDSGICRIRPNKLKCHALIHLNGEIGGIGDIGVSGDIERGDYHLNVYGGSWQFDSVAGRVAMPVNEHRRIDRFDLH